MGLLAGRGKEKDEVNYRQYEKCATCTHFYSPNSCDRVAGNISPEAVCSLWEMKESKSNIGADGNDYIKEYNKNPTKFAKEF